MESVGGKGANNYWMCDWFGLEREYNKIKFVLSHRKKCLMIYLI